MSTSNEIPDRDFERQSTNRTQTLTFFYAVMSILDVVGSTVNVAFPPARVAFGM